MDSERKETLDVIQQKIDDKNASLEKIRTALESSHPELVGLMKKILESFSRLHANSRK